MKDIKAVMYYGMPPVKLQGKIKNGARFFLNDI